MLYKAANLKEAISLAEEMKRNGQANWFRGQSRNWPLLSSLGRIKNQDKLEAVKKRHHSYYSWVHSLPDMKEFAQNKDKALAVAQHYGWATHFLDFTTEPKVAAFFAANNPPPPDNDDQSCIICLNYHELKEIWEGIKIVQPDLPEPRTIIVDIPELWRIQAQYGAFLYYPYNTGFEHHFFDFDRIIFPTERNPAVLTKLIPKEDIYPPQKSHLEVLLDQFFMLEKMPKGSKVLKEKAKKNKGFQIIDMKQSPNPDGIEAECFGLGGLPVHESWNASNLESWRSPQKERWEAISAAPLLTIDYPNVGNSHNKIQNLSKQIIEIHNQNHELRTMPVKWNINGPYMQAKQINQSLGLLWDGLRRWPYELDEIAQALSSLIEFGMLVSKNPTADLYPHIAKDLAVKCFGDVIEVEIGMEDGSYTRGYANREVLRRAVRDDFFSFLNKKYRPQIKNLRHILQIAFNPQRTLNFNRLKSVFCTQIVPTQVVLRGIKSGKARLYTPALAKSIGLL